jgi:hypothetical protein
MPEAFGSLYATNHTEVGASTAAAIGGPGVHIAKIVVTTALAGPLTVNDNATAASGPLIFTSGATSTAGTIFDLHVRCKFGAWVANSAAGTVSVYWN